MRAHLEPHIRPPAPPPGPRVTPPSPGGCPCGTQSSPRPAPRGPSTPGGPSGRRGLEVWLQNHHCGPSRRKHCPSVPRPARGALRGPAAPPPPCLSCHPQGRPVGAGQDLARSHAPQCRGKRALLCEHGPGTSGGRPGSVQGPLSAAGLKTVFKRQRGARFTSEARRVARGGRPGPRAASTRPYCARGPGRSNRGR